jgi:hypothetical protein
LNDSKERWSVLPFVPTRSGGFRRGRSTSHEVVLFCRAFRGGLIALRRLQRCTRGLGPFNVARARSMDARSLALVSYDLLVIDLDSLREHAAEIFKRLHQHRNILRRYRANDMRDAADAEFSEFLAEDCNKHFDALFPDGEPAEHPERIDDMIERFKAANKPTERDRNEARAHRFGKRAKNARAAFQTLQEGNRPEMVVLT